MVENVNRNNNISNSRFFLPSPQKYLSKEEFQEYLSLVKQIANFDPSSKKWYLNEYKVKTLSKEILKDTVDRLKDYIGDEIYNIFTKYIRNDEEVIRAEIKGNYLYVHDDLNKYKNLLSYKIKVFDYKEGKYNEETVLLAWQKEFGFVTLRGLYWKLQTVSNIDLKPFANLTYHDITLKTFELRDYQLNSIKAWLNDVNTVGAGVIKAPTGSGKSIMAILSALEMLKNKPDAKIVYTVGSTVLLKQFQQFSRKEDLQFIIVSGELDEMKKGEKSDLIALSIQYYYSQKKRNQHEKIKELLSSADLIIIDEAHHTPTQSIKSLLQDAPNSVRLGLTATPLREDNRELEMAGFLGRISYSIEYTQLVEKGYLAPITYITFTPKIPKKLAIKIKKIEQNKDELNFAQFYSALLKLFEKSPNTNQQIINKIKELNQFPALVIVRRIEIAKRLAQLMQNNGLRADFVTSKTNLEERIKKIEDLKTGKLQVLISTSLADEGLDIPQLKLLILMTQGKSRVKLIQRIGRVMRTFPGKNQGYVLDIAYNHDLFLRQSLKRLKFIENEYQGIVKIIS